jgi:serine/threonine protein kinase
MEDPEDQENVTHSRSDDSTQSEGDRIGSYRLIRSLGEGGMGIVYLAEQVEPMRRQVALKIIKPGMDSKRVIARFEAERQALALLEHPNIAHVYEAGATEVGRPYFVMEYVKGLPITDYCDHHKLTIEDRLNLFRQVCLAVHHAHQKGIIHRDIKPSNILISVQDGQAVPKIIDFGVAKAITQPLTERTLATEDSQLLGTPEYMSPEQADMANEDIDTRSDIYSLGVLLYVLLTGILPFDSDTLRKGGIDHIRQVIRERDPKTPSTRLTKLGDEAVAIAQNRRIEIQTLARHLRKELEWIPLKAMRKERSERYRSASELADEIENYLKGDQLIAAPLSTMYRFKKFIRWNKALVGGIFAVVVVSLIGAAVSLIFALGQTRARSEAQAIADFLKNDVLASLGPGKTRGRDVTFRYVLDAASENLVGKFKDQPLVEASLRDTLGWTYRMLSESKAAEPHLERALQIRQEHLGEGYTDTLSSVGRLAWLRIDQGRNTEAEELLEKGLSISRRTLGDGHIKTLSFTNTLGILYKDMGHFDEAEQVYLISIPVARRVHSDKHLESLFMVGNLGQVYAAQGRYDEAEHQYKEMLRLRDGVLDDEHMYTLRYKCFLADLYTKQKRFPEARELYLEILPIQRRDLGDDHSMTLYSSHRLAQVYMHMGEYDKAEPLLLQAIKSRRLKLGDTHPGTLESWQNLIELYEASNKPEKAEEWRAILPQTEAVEQ